MNKEELYALMKQSVIDGEKEKAVALAKEAITHKLNLTEVIEKGFTPGIQKVGDMWEKGEYFLPELLTSAECMKEAMQILQPELEKSKTTAQSQGKVVIGTVEGDIHDIGKNLVASMLSANGYNVYDLGGDVKPEKFIEKAVEVDADIICLSALLTTTMVNQRKLIEMLIEKDLASRFKVMVGGAPVNQRWADDIGAGGYAENAMTAVKVLKNVLST